MQTHSGGPCKDATRRRQCLLQAEERGLGRNQPCSAFIWDSSLQNGRQRVSAVRGTSSLELCDGNCGT